jgi:hypothetical protein
VPRALREDRATIRSAAQRKAAARAGHRDAGARDAYEKAARLATGPAQQRYLYIRAAHLGGVPETGPGSAPDRGTP